jgi:hypothetical protein
VPIPKQSRTTTPLTPLGIPGYTLWTNLYVSSGALLAIQPDRRDPTEPEWLATRQIMSGEKRPTGGYGAADEERWRVVDESVASGELGKRAIVLNGVTVSWGVFGLCTVTVGIVTGHHKEGCLKLVLDTRRSVRS